MSLSYYFVVASHDDRVIVRKRFYRFTLWKLLLLLLPAITEYVCDIFTILFVDYHFTIVILLGVFFFSFVEFVVFWLTLNRILKYFATIPTIMSFSSRKRHAVLPLQWRESTLFIRPKYYDIINLVIIITYFNIDIIPQSNAFFFLDYNIMPTVHSSQQYPSENSFKFWYKRMFRYLHRYNFAIIQLWQATIIDTCIINFQVLIS